MLINNKFKAFMIVSRYEYMPAAINEVGLTVVMVVQHLDQESMLQLDLQ